MLESNVFTWNLDRFLEIIEGLVVRVERSRIELEEIPKILRKLIITSGGISRLEIEVYFLLNIFLIYFT